MGELPPKKSRKKVTSEFRNNEGLSEISSIEAMKTGVKNWNSLLTLMEFDKNCLKILSQVNADWFFF